MEILIFTCRNFTYEGKAPDAFLIAGINSPEANDKPEVVFPFPFEVSLLLQLKVRSAGIKFLIFRVSTTSIQTDK